MKSTITPSKFSIMLVLEKGSDKYNTANLVKDAISQVKGNLPSDMNELTVSVPEDRKTLMGGL